MSVSFRECHGPMLEAFFQLYESHESLSSPDQSQPSHASSSPTKDVSSASQR